MMITALTTASAFPLISISFDVPDLFDEEMAYVFAPQVGPVQIIGAWVTQYLAAWELK